MPRKDPKLMPLLRALAGTGDSLRDARPDEDFVDLAVSFGLGALLRHAARGDLGAFPEPCRPRIVGSELAAETAHADLEAALCRILDESRAHMSPITLLKGISVREHYPMPHMRWMSDIDLLVDSTEQAALENILKRLGYGPHESDLPDSFYRDHHHSRPFVHRRTEVRVEVHTSLLPPRFGIPPSSALGPDNVRANSVPSTFAGRQVFRFGDELQLAYICAHWLYDLNVSLALAAGGLIDTLFILADVERPIDWDLMSSWLRHREVAMPLLVLLGYLRRAGLVEPDSRFATALARAPRSAGRLGLRTLYRVVDTCLDGGFEGRFATPDNAAIVWRTLAFPSRPATNLLRVPLDLCFPPDHPERFSLGFQRRRIRSLLHYQ